MFRRFFDRFRAKSVSSTLSETAPSLATASVEEIWRSWRHAKPDHQNSAYQEPVYQKPVGQKAREESPSSENLAKRIRQLKRLGAYENVLQIALLELERQERQGRPNFNEQAEVPWYYLEAASIYRRLERYDEEIALIRRFARNCDLSSRAVSTRRRSTPSAHEAWAAQFLDRLKAAETALAERQKYKT